MRLVGWQTETAFYRERGVASGKQCEPPHNDKTLCQKQKQHLRTSSLLPVFRCLTAQIRIGTNGQKKRQEHNSGLTKRRAAVFFGWCSQKTFTFIVASICSLIFEATNARRGFFCCLYWRNERALRHVLHCAHVKCAEHPSIEATGRKTPTPPQQNFAPCGQQLLG